MKLDRLRVKIVKESGAFRLIDRNTGDPLEIEDEVVDLGGFETAKAANAALWCIRDAQRVNNTLSPDLEECEDQLLLFRARWGGNAELKEFSFLPEEGEGEPGDP